MSVTRNLITIDLSKAGDTFLIASAFLEWRISSEEKEISASATDAASLAELGALYEYLHLEG